MDIVVAVVVVAVVVVDDVVVVVSLHDVLLDVACCYCTTPTGVVVVGITAAAAAVVGNSAVNVRRSAGLVACCPSGRPILFLGREIGAPREGQSGPQHSSFLSLSLSLHFTSLPFFLLVSFRRLGPFFS